MDWVTGELGDSIDLEAGAADRRAPPAIYSTIRVGLQSISLFSHHTYHTYVVDYRGIKLFLFSLSLSLSLSHQKVCVKPWQWGSYTKHEWPENREFPRWLRNQVKHCVAHQFSVHLDELDQ